MRNESGTGGIELLLVEDNPGDVRLTREALEETGRQIGLNVVNDGIQALRYLRRQAPYVDAPRPNLILLDLNLPKKDGREVLAEIKTDEDLRMIPVVVMTTSDAQLDIRRAYSLHANCYVTKPPDFDAFVGLVQSIEQFWLSVAKVPS
jgi:two-component system response regulator